MKKTIKRIERGIEVPPGFVVPQIENDLTRRDFLMAGAAAMLLGGCGGGEGSGGEADSSGGTRTVEHKYGSTEVSAMPERVVTVGLTDHDAVLALGVVPVGVTKWMDRIIWPWAESEIEGAKPEVVGEVGEIDFESVAALEPDLILGLYSGLTEDKYETLSEIAPTIAQPGEHVDYGIPWQKQTRTTGRALGREERAEELIADRESRFADAREEHPEFEGATGAVAGGADGTYFLYGPEDPRGRFLTSLGFTIPAEITELAGEEFYATISGERLDFVDTDVLVWLASETQREAIEDNPIYRQLEVAGEGRDIFLTLGGPSAAALEWSTVLSLPLALEETVPRLAAAVDGDPETEVEEAE